MASRERRNRDIPASGRGTKVLPRRAGSNTPRDDEDIVEAELVDEPESGPDDRRQRLRDGARAFFGGAKRWADERRARQEEEQFLIEHESPGMSEREHLLTLRAQVRMAGEQYLVSLRESKLFVPGFSEQEQEREFNVMHRVYMQMMMQGCLRPLSQGVNPNAIIQSVGMMMTMRLLSKDFRKETDQFVQPLKDAVHAKIDARTRSVGQSAQGAAERYNSLKARRNELRGESLQQRLAKDPALGDDPAFREKLAEHRRQEATTAENARGRGDYLSRKWQRRLDDLERRERGHRELFTPESAALTEVGLMENAFWKMREGGDVDEIDASYRAMSKRLHEQMTDDGLSRDEVIRRARMIIGERIQAEPELRLMFNGMAHGRINKAPAHLERIEGTDRVREVWTGEFEDNLGRRIKKEGMFTLRRPMTAAEHQAQMGTTMADSMLRALRSDDPTAYGASVLGYLGGFVHRRDGGSKEDLAPVLVGPIDQSETMQAAMAVDGLDDDESQLVYSRAFSDAMETVAQAHEGIEDELRRSFGEDWQQALQDAVDDPRAFYARHAAGPADFEASAGGPTRFKPFVRDWGYSSRSPAEDGEHQPA